MIFRIVGTFEKPDTKVVELMWGYSPYIKLLECYLFDGNPYSVSSHRLADDGSYAEMYLNYHSEQFYRMWYDEFKDQYIPLIKEVFDKFRSQGIQAQLYFDPIDLPGLPEDRKPLTSFVSRFQ
jgi:hypothetical protein